MDERNSNYKLTTARNGLTVPVINGIHLHSVYNPTKEAEAFVKGYENILSHKKYVLVLGLGFGYHIEQIAKQLNDNHKDYQIVVLESSKQLIEDFNLTRPFEDRRISIKQANTTETLFSDWQFIQFLMKKPAIIKHDTSFSLNKDFYTNFLSFQASRSINNYRSLLRANAYKWLAVEDREESFTDKVELLRQSNKQLSQNDFHILTIDAIRNYNVKEA